jgi:hypothetical protein
MKKAKSPVIRTLSCHSASKNRRQRPAENRRLRRYNQPPWRQPWWSCRRNSRSGRSCEPPHSTAPPTMEYRIRTAEVTPMADMALASIEKTPVSASFSVPRSFTALETAMLLFTACPTKAKEFALSMYERAALGARCRSDRALGTYRDTASAANADSSGGLNHPIR